MVGLRSCALLLAILFAAGSAAAATGTVHGSVALPVETIGERTFEATNGAMLAQGDSGELNLVLEGEAGTATRVVYRGFGYVHPNDPRAEVRWGERYEEHEISLDDATLRLDARRGDFKLLTFDSQVAIASSESEVPIGITTSGIEVDHNLPSELYVGIDASGKDGFSYRIPAQLYQVQPRAGTATASGDVHLFAVDATFVLDGPDGRQLIRAHPRMETHPGSIYNPLDGTWFGAGSHDEYVHEYLLISGVGNLELQFQGLAIQTFTDALTAKIEGTSRLPAMTGTIAISDEETHTLNRETVELTGIHEIRLHGANAQNARTAIEGEGDYTIVRYGVVAAEYDWATAAAAATIGTVLLGIVAWLGGQLKTILGGGGAAIAGYARVHGNKVLEHPGRTEVYDRIKANPGISMAELARAVDFGESTLNYHLRVLAKNEFVTQVRDGRYLRFFDRQTGLYANERKHAISALQNTTSQRIAAAIRETPGVAQRELANQFGVAPSTVNWHVRRLSQVGLVDARRDHPHTRYYPGEAWAGLPSESNALYA